MWNKETSHHFRHEFLICIPKSFKQFTLWFIQNIRINIHCIHTICTVCTPSPHQATELPAFFSSIIFRSSFICSLWRPMIQWLHTTHSLEFNKKKQFLFSSLAFIYRKFQRKAHYYILCGECVSSAVAIAMAAVVYIRCCYWWLWCYKRKWALRNHRLWLSCTPEFQVWRLCSSLCHHIICVMLNESNVSHSNSTHSHLILLSCSLIFLSRIKNATIEQWKRGLVLSRRGILIQKPFSFCIFLLFMFGCSAC